MLNSPGFDQAEALEQQIHLLELQKRRIQELICLAREIKEKGTEKGVCGMNFDAFSKDEIARYEAEVKERWGATRDYEEYARKSPLYSSTSQRATIPV